MKGSLSSGLRMSHVEAVDIEVFAGDTKQVSALLTENDNRILQSYLVMGTKLPIFKVQSTLLVSYRSSD